MNIKVKYVVDWNWKQHPAGLKEHRSHYKTLADARHWIKSAIQDNAIYVESIKVYSGHDTNKVDVTEWALEPLANLI